MVSRMHMRCNVYITHTHAIWRTIHVCAHTYIYTQYITTNMCTCMAVRTYMYVCTYVRYYTRLHELMYNMYVCMYAYTHMCMQAHAQVGQRNMCVERRGFARVLTFSIRILYMHACTHTCIHA